MRVDKLYDVLVACVAEEIEHLSKVRSYFPKNREKSRPNGFEPAPKNLDKKTLTKKGLNFTLGFPCKEVVHHKWLPPNKAQYLCTLKECKKSLFGGFCAPPWGKRCVQSQFNIFTFVRYSGTI